jgi:putative ABC transport system permease protein
VADPSCHAGYATSSKMNIADLIKLAWQSISSSKMRSGLTVLGIIIGIGAVIALLAIGQGAKLETDKQIQTLGTNLIFIRPGSANAGHVSMGVGSSNTLTWEDANAIGRICPAVELVVPGMQGPQQVQFGNFNTNTTVCAVTPDYPYVRSFYPKKGRFFNESEMEHNARVCCLGETVAEGLFGDEDPIGKTVLIKGEWFKVIAVMEHKGASMFSDQDDQVFIPLSTGMYRMFGFKPARGKQVGFMMVQAKSADHVLPAVFQITNVLRLRHKIVPPNNDDFFVRTQAEIMQTADSVTTVFTILLGSTAGISLLVGGIGIMNIMLVSVTERTREIGIRKALGARQGDILWQFVIEATVLSFTGGVVGILLGIGASQAVAYFVKWTTVVTPLSVVLSFGVSILVGMFFGIYPARQAAKLDPIDALRAE